MSSAISGTPRSAYQARSGSGASASTASSSSSSSPAWPSSPYNSSLPQSRNLSASTQGSSSSSSSSPSAYKQEIYQLSVDPPSSSSPAFETGLSASLSSRTIRANDYPQQHSHQASGHHALAPAAPIVALNDDDAPFSSQQHSITHKSSQGRLKSLFQRKSVKNLRAEAIDAGTSAADNWSVPPVPALPGSPATVKHRRGSSPHAAQERSPYSSSPERSEMSGAAGRSPYAYGVGIGAAARNEAKVSSLGLRDDLDEMAYGYALKVAYIHRVLRTNVLQGGAGAGASSGSKSPAPMSPQSDSGTSRYSSTSPGSTPVPAQNPYFPPTGSSSSPSAGAQETLKSRFTFGKKRSATADSVPSVSGSGAAAGAKLPKDFLPMFWETLTAEHGDSVWRMTVTGFMSTLPSKKAAATKTMSGANLREIPVLLECFSSHIPDSTSGIPPSPGFAASRSPRQLPPLGGSSVHKHTQVAHLCSLLGNSLHVYFTAGNRKLTEADRELHARIQAEIDQYSLQDGERSASFGGRSADGNLSSSPVSESPSMFGESAYSTDVTTPSSHIKSPNGLAPIPLIRTDTQMSARKASDHVDLIDVVRRVFGVDSLRLGRDLESLKRAGLNERSYLSDIKAHLTATSNNVNAKHSTFLTERVASLQAELATLLQARPDLSSSLPFGQQARQEGDLYFTPNTRKDDVYIRLVERAHLVLGSETPLFRGNFGERELIEMCAGIWGIQAKSAKELQAVVGIWKSAVHEHKQMELGRRRSSIQLRYISEMEWAKRVKEALAELEFDAEAGMDATDRRIALRPLWALHDYLQKCVADAVTTIYPTTATPPAAPPASVTALLAALYGSPKTLTILPPEVVVDSWNKIADELRAHAVGEYVQKTTEFLGEDSSAGTPSDSDSQASGQSKDNTLLGFERLADWIESGIRRVARVWPRNLIAGRLSPTATILSKQLPLFLAELHVLEGPETNSIRAESVFGLYEKTARLLSLWEDFCPELDSGFDLDGFFEPYVRAWLRDTDEVQTHEWVRRAVTLDRWTPEGSLNHSQSVLDLFDFIRRAVSRLLTELPLGEYNRACYIIDFSRTASAAITEYATTVQALFATEISGPVNDKPKMADVPSAVTGKAGAWLAKSKLAVKSLDRKKIEGFVVPPTACVKLTDMAAARACLEDLAYAMEADETARIVKEHRLKTGLTTADKPARYLFTITLSRGENLLAKGLSKPADAFVCVMDPSAGQRIHKSKTILGQLDPHWEESFELGIGGPKSYEIACFDRSLVGKHELIGTATFKVDPYNFSQTPSQDLTLPLNPRGSVTIRVELNGGEKHDVRCHLNRAGRALDRATQEMASSIVDKMTEYIRSQLSLAAVQNLTRPLMAKPKKGQAKVMTISDHEYEQSLAPLFEYLDANFSTFAVSFSDELRVHVLTLVWRRCLGILISILVPPLSDKEASNAALSGQEVAVVFQWLKVSARSVRCCSITDQHLAAALEDVFQRRRRKRRARRSLVDLASRYLQGRHDHWPIPRPAYSRSQGKVHGRSQGSPQASGFATEPEHP